MPRNIKEHLEVSNPHHEDQSMKKISVLSIFKRLYRGLTGNDLPENLLDEKSDNLSPSDLDEKKKDLKS